MFKTGIPVNPDVIGLVLLIQNKQREFVMLANERLSVFLYLESVCLFLTY